MIVNKTTKDYINELCEMYPTVLRKDIETILNYGWKMLYLLNSYGGDVLIDNKKLWCYFGCLYKNSLLHFNHYVKKLVLKFRVLYRRRKIEWDGYYYFALTDSQYEEYLSLISKKGRKRKKFILHKVFLYKMLDECKVKQRGLKYIFRIKYCTELGFKIYKEEFIAVSPELIIIRNPLTLKDILISNNNYLLL